MAAARHAARTTVGGTARCGETADKDTGQRTNTMHTRVHGRGRRLRVPATKVAWRKKQRPGREAPLLMPIVAPPGDSFPHAFPTPEFRPVSRDSPLRPSSMWLSRHPSSMWLSTVLPIPASWPHPANRYPTIHRPYPRAPYPSPHPAMNHLCLPGVPAGRSYPCPGRSRAGSQAHGSSLGLVRASDAW